MVNDMPAKRMGYFHCLTSQTAQVHILPNRLILQFLKVGSHSSMN